MKNFHIALIALTDLDAVMRSVYDTASCAPQLRWMIVFLSV